jgi:hypothetical protein
LGQALQSVFRADARYMDHLIQGFGGNWGRAATSVGKPADWWLGTTTGLFKDDPAGAARDVQWVYEEAARLNLGRGGLVRELGAKLRAVRQAETIADREAAAREARRYATEIRDAWEKEPPVEVP